MSIDTYPHTDILNDVDDIPDDGMFDTEPYVDDIIDAVREGLLSDAAVEAALIQFMADSSFIAAPAARQWWNRLKDEPEHGEDFSDSKYLYREAMRSGMIAALALDAALTNGGDNER